MRNGVRAGLSKTCFLPGKDCNNKQLATLLDFQTISSRLSKSSPALHFFPHVRSRFTQIHVTIQKWRQSLLPFHGDFLHTVLTISVVCSPPYWSSLDTLFSWVTVIFFEVDMDYFELLDQILLQPFRQELLHLKKQQTQNTDHYLHCFRVLMFDCLNMNMHIFTS